MTPLPARGNAAAMVARPGGGTGIRSRLKICRSQGHEGSIPSLGTMSSLRLADFDYNLPFFEDTLAGKRLQCNPKAPDDFYPSNKISLATIAKYGKP